MQAKNTEARIAFYQEHREALDACARFGFIVYRDHPHCRTIVELARDRLGYSAKTSLVDIYRPLMRGYKAWRAQQQG